MADSGSTEEKGKVGQPVESPSLPHGSMPNATSSEGTISGNSHNNQFQQRSPWSTEAHHLHPGMAPSSSSPSMAPQQQWPSYYWQQQQQPQQPQQQLQQQAQQSSPGGIRLQQHPSSTYPSHMLPSQMHPQAASSSYYPPGVPLPPNVPVPGGQPFGYHFPAAAPHGSFQPAQMQHFQQQQQRFSPHVAQQPPPTAQPQQPQQQPEWFNRGAAAAATPQAASTSTQQQPNQQPAQPPAPSNRPPLSSPATSSGGYPEESNDSSFQSPPLSTATTATAATVNASQTPTPSLQPAQSTPHAPRQSKKQKAAAAAAANAAAAGNSADGGGGAPEVRIGGLTQAQRDVVEKLVGAPCETVPAHVMPERRRFFEQIVLLSEQYGDPLLAAPQVSKTSVDLHRIYCAVRHRGGFEKVTRDKLWKAFCPEANPAMQESSAAGYQLRRHYQKYLLPLECMETGQNLDALNEFAEKMKKKKKEVKPSDTPSTKDSAPSTSQVQVPPTPQALGMFPPGGSIPPQGQYPGADGALPYFYPGTSQQPQHFPPGHPAWVGGGQWGAATAGYYPSAAMRPTPHSVGKPSPGGEVQPSEAQRMQQQQQYYQQQQQMARAMQHQAAWEARNSSSSSTAPMPANSSGGHLDAVGQQQQRQQESAATRETGDESQGGVGEARPASRRQAPTPAAYSSATAPTPPLMYSAPSAPVMGQPPPTTSAPNQFYQPAPNVYAMRPASSIQQGQSSQPPAAPARQPFGTTAAKAPPYGNPQYPSGTDPHPGGGGVPAYSQYAPHTAWPQYPHSAQRPFAPTDEMTSHHAMMLQRMQPPQVASSQQIQQQWEMQRRAQNAGHYLGTAPTVQPSIASTSMATAPGIPSIPAHPHHQSHLPSPGSQQARGRGAHAHQQTTAVAMQSTPPMRPSQPPPHLASYPPDSIEAMALSPLVLKKKRPKVFARDLTMVSSRRIMMALRSGQLLDTTWALNALNVMLYDDSSAGSFNLNNMPELLNIIIEHFAAMLSVLYTRDFKKFAPAMDKEMASRRIKREQLDDEVCESDPHLTIVKPPMGKASSSKRTPNFTRTSRTGRLVKEEPTQSLPAELEKFMAEANSQDDFENSRAERANLAFGRRIEDSLLTWIKQRQKCKRPTFNGWVKKRKEQDEDVMDLLVAATGGAEENSNEIATPSAPEHRHNGGGEKWDRHATPDFSLVARMVAVVSRDEGVVELTNRCLALSNILRGFSFIIGNERPLARHPALLPMIAKLLKLCVREAESAEQLSDKSGGDGRIQKAERGSRGSEGKFHFLSKLSSDPGAKPDCPPEEDSERKLLLETANHLRDDAFVLLSHISVQVGSGGKEASVTKSMIETTLQLDLFEMDSSVTWSILDALLYWATSTSLAARDSLQPAGMISPRNYSLEILCKMSVIERNIDLLVSTGPWPRVEELVLVLCNMINLGEELPQREFAIVILNAVCGASEAACHVAAKESDLLGHLVSFLESADMAMHQIVQHQGIHALKDNPELMGTSVGMLRRASSIMLHIARLESCRDCFCKLQNRLLQFTVSHFMDSRVAAAVSEILFEMQKGELAGASGNGSMARQAEQIVAPRASSSLVLSPEVHDDDVSQLSTATTTEAVISEGMTMASKNGDEAETDEAIHRGTSASAYALMNGHGGDVPPPCSKERRTRKRPNNSPLNNGVVVAAAADNGNHVRHTNVVEALYESGETIAKRASHEAVKEKLRNNLIQKHEGAGNVDGLQAEVPNGLFLPGTGVDIGNDEQKVNGAH